MKTPKRIRRLKIRIIENKFELKVQAEIEKMNEQIELLKKQKIVIGSF